VHDKAKLCILIWLTTSIVTAITLWYYEDNCCNVTLCIAIRTFWLQCQLLFSYALCPLCNMACAVIYYALLNNFLSWSFPKLSYVCICLSVCLLCIVTYTLLWLCDKNVMWLQLGQKSVGNRAVCGGRVV